MRYYKMISDGYLLSIGSGGKSGEEITEKEYNDILNAIHNAPVAPDGYAYRLKTDLTWELYEMPVVVEEELTAEEALTIILGGET